MTTEAVRSRKRRHAAFLSNDRGVAAIEFALVVPMLLVLYLGSVDLCLGITLSRKVQHASSMMNDLATRVNNIKKDDLDGIFDMADAMVAPRAPGLTSASIIGIYIDDKGKATVSWSRGQNTQPEAVGKTISLPANLKDLKKVNLVRSVATYNYQPIGTFGFVDPFEMKQEVFSKPRVGDSVNCSDCASK